MSFLNPYCTLVVVLDMGVAEYGAYENIRQILSLPSEKWNSKERLSCNITGAIYWESGAFFHMGGTSNADLKKSKKISWGSGL